KDFNAAYERKTRTEDLALEYERLLVEHPDLTAKLDAMPGRVFSGKGHPTPGTKAVFFCFTLPARVAPHSPLNQPTLFDPNESDNPPTGWSLTEGPVRWYLYDLAHKKVQEPDAPILADLIRCKPDEPRKVSSDAPTLAKIRAAVEKHIKDTYLKSAQA